MPRRAYNDDLQSCKALIPLRPRPIHSIGFFPTIPRWDPLDQEGQDSNLRWTSKHEQRTGQDLSYSQDSVSHESKHRITSFSVDLAKTKGISTFPLQFHPYAL